MRDQQKINEELAKVLPLHAMELRESTDERKRVSEDWLRAERSAATTAVRAESARWQHDEVLPAEWPAGLLDRAAAAEAAEVDRGEAQLIE